MPNNHQDQNQIFQILVERTRNFHLENLLNEPKYASEDELRQFRLKDIINRVVNMGIRAYYQAPENSRTVHTKDDWIQDAMVIFIQQVEEYDPNKGVPFNRFILFRVRGRLNNRLTEIRRRIGREMETRVPPEKTGSLEDDYIQKERHNILWSCIDKLSPPELRLLFIRHEIEGISLRKLYDDLEMDRIGNIRLSSIETFRRHYKKNARLKVAICVTSFLNDSVRSLRRRQYQRKIH